MRKTLSLKRDLGENLGRQIANDRRNDWIKKIDYRDSLQSIRESRYDTERPGTTSNNKKIQTKYILT